MCCSLCLIIVLGCFSFSSSVCSSSFVLLIHVCLKRNGLTSKRFIRFYIMHLEDRPLKFSTITHHASVTQCLGSIGGHVWYLGVAKPSIVDPSDIKGTIGADVVKSHCGHFYVPPAVDDVRVFKISGPKFLKLNRGTWHAGPLFLQKTMDFYNLELSNTNVSTSCFCLQYFSIIIDAL